MTAKILQFVSRYRITLFVILAVAVGFWIFGQQALYGLLAMLFGLKDLKRKQDRATIIADEHETLAHDLAVDAKAGMDAADAKREQSNELVEDITEPKIKPAGSKRRRFTAH